MEAIQGKRGLAVSVILFILWPLAFSFHLNAQESALSDLNLNSLEKKEEALRWGRDPFVLPDQGRVKKEKEGHQDEFRLSAIIYREGNGVAIINDKIVRTGDVLGGMRVGDIHQDRVILNGTSGEKVLRVDQFLIGP
jgi:hypothetical protein